MIRASTTKTCTVAKTTAGSVVLYHHGAPGSERWLSCLSVKASEDGGVTLLALDFGEGRMPFLMRDVGANQCVQLGPAEARFEFSGPTKPKAGALALSSNGPAVVGRLAGKDREPVEKWWVISTGEPMLAESSAFRPARWEIGIYTEGHFEQVATFPPPPPQYLATPK
jgi:hypothetical protein